MAAQNNTKPLFLGVK